MTFARELRETGSFVLAELKPKGRMLTPFNLISIPVIVSGGVSKVDDLVASAALAGDGIAGAIVGRALYTGAVDLADALARVEEASSC